MLSCEFCKIFKNTFSYRTTPVAASAYPIFPFCLQCVLLKKRLWHKCFRNTKTAWIVFSFKVKHILLEQCFFKLTLGVFKSKGVYFILCAWHCVVYDNADFVLILITRSRQYHGTLLHFTNLQQITSFNILFYLPQGLGWKIWETF